MSAAEKQRRYRARRDADPARRAAHLEKQREAWHKLRSQGKVKTVAEISEGEKRSKRAYWRKAQQRCRERPRRLDNLATPPDSPDSQVVHQPQETRQPLKLWSEDCTDYTKMNEIDQALQRVAVMRNFLTDGAYPDNFKGWQRQNVRRMAPTFRIESNGRMYHFSKGLKHLVLESEDEIIFALTKFHCNESGGHHGIMKTRDAITARYYWPGMSVHIRNWVEGCEGCQKMETDGKPAPKPQPTESLLQEVSDIVRTAKITKAAAGPMRATKSNAPDFNKQTLNVGDGRHHLVCPYCFYQCRSNGTLYIHMGSNHPLHCDDIPIGVLGKAVFYQRTAKLFHCKTCFFTSKDYTRVFDHLLVNHCFSSKVPQTVDVQEQGCGNGFDETEEKGELSDGNESRDVPEAERVVEDMEEDAVSDTKRESEITGETKDQIPAVVDLFRSEKDEKESPEEQSANEDSNLSGGSLKRKRSSASDSEEAEEEEDEDVEDDEDLGAYDSKRNSQTEEEDKVIYKYIRRMGGRFYCKFCNWRNKVKGFMLYHISKKHNVPKPHSCQECGKAFLLETILLNHVGLHHKQGLYKCPFCVFQSNFLRGIRRHLNHCISKPGGEAEADVDPEVDV